MTFKNREKYASAIRENHTSGSLDNCKFKDIKELIHSMENIKKLMLFSSYKDKCNEETLNYIIFYINFIIQKSLILEKRMEMQHENFHNTLENKRHIEFANLSVLSGCN